MAIAGTTEKPSLFGKKTGNKAYRSKVPYNKENVSIIKINAQKCQMLQRMSRKRNSQVSLQDEVISRPHVNYSGQILHRWVLDDRPK